MTSELRYEVALCIRDLRARRQQIPGRWRHAQRTIAHLLVSLRKYQRGGAR